MPVETAAEAILYGAHPRGQTAITPVKLFLDLDQLGILLKVVRIYADDAAMTAELVERCRSQGMDLRQEVDPTRPGWSYLPGWMRRQYKHGDSVQLPFCLAYTDWLALMDVFLPRAITEHPAATGGRVNLRALVDTIASQL